MTATFTPGTLVIVGRRLGRIIKESRLGSVHGYDVTAAIEAHEGYAPHFVADNAIKPAELGMTVCRKPQGECWCGLVHVGQHELEQLALRERAA